MAEVTPPAGVDPTATGMGAREMGMSRQLYQTAADGGADLVKLNAEWKEAGGQGDITATKAPDAAPVGEQEILDKELPAAKPEEYQLPPIDSKDSAEITRIAATTRGWLAEAQLPKEIGSYIAKEAGAVAAKFEKMTDGQKEVFQVAERAKLDRLWGPNAQRNIDVARQLVREIAATERGKGVVEFLERSGAGNSATVIAQLAQHGLRLAARRG